MNAKEKLIVSALRAGMVLILLYFGVQIIAAPFYPGYSFFNNDASTLGSAGSHYPAIFNIGSIIVGVVMLFASWGFLRAFQRLGAHPVAAWLTFFAFIAGGLAGINAGIFPLPDPRHTDSFPALLGIVMFLLPILLPVTCWKIEGRRKIQVYYVINFIIIMALIPNMSGLIQRFSIMAGVDIPGYQHFLNNYHGLLQRIAVFSVFFPVSITAYLLIKRIKDEVQS